MNYTKRTKRARLLLLLWLALPCFLKAQILPKDWQRAVVLIEQSVTVNDSIQYQPIGTGFLLQRKLPDKQTRVYVVTAGHVTLLVPGHRIFVRLDKKESGFFRLPITLAAHVAEEGDFVTAHPGGEGGQPFRVSKTLGIAAIDVTDVNVPNDLNNAMFDISVVLSERRYSELGLIETDRLFIISYDTGLQLPIVRSGMVSAILPNKSFYAEASVYGSDSGSPVVLQLRKPGVLETRTPVIIGVVSDTIERLAPVGKFGPQNVDLFLPRCANLALVQPSHVILDMLASL